MKRIASRAATFLIEQRSPHWSWNYWVRGSADSDKLPCPDDLDDTFAALEALHIHMPEQIDGTALASVVRVLTTAEEKPGGPYNTWLVGETDDQRWNDIDPVVNANVAAFLKSEHIVLPPVNELVQKTIRDICAGKPVHSKYYASPIPALYFLSRSLDLNKDKAPAELISDFLLKKRGAEGHWSSPVETACAVTTLIRCGSSAEDFRPAIEYALSKAEDSGWKAYGLYTETAFGGTPSFAGADALSTAVCLEAIAVYEKAAVHPKKSARGTKSVPSPRTLDPGPSFSREAIGIEQRVIEAFEKRLESDAIMSRHGHAVLEKVLARDAAKQITLLPYFFKKSLSGDESEGSELGHAEDQLLIRLGLANLHGWIAYRIYDDFLDDEGSPELIPLAALSLREVSRIYSEALPQDHSDVFIELMDAMDSANAWERASAYFPDRSFLDQDAELPDYKEHTVLADKSLPHCLGPIALIIDAHGEDGWDEARADIRAAKGFFRHYIIARQLNDDAHDWLEDLGRGFVNSAATRMLKSIRAQEEAGMKTFAFRERSERSSGPLSPETVGFLQGIFWREVMPGIADHIRAEIDAARKHLVSIGVVRDLSYLESLLAPLEAGADKAMSERQKTLAFLSEYKKTPS